VKGWASFFRVAVAVEVPRRVTKVSIVSVSRRAGPPAAATRHVDELGQLARGDRRPGELGDGRQFDRELVVGNRDQAAVGQ